MTIAINQCEVHRHRITYRHYVPAVAADADPVVLLHGIAGSGRTWEPVLGQSASPGFNVLVAFRRMVRNAGG